MTTHRNLKPHYAERKGKSGPVIVVKKATEPTEAEQALLDWIANGAIGDPRGFLFELKREARDTERVTRFEVIDGTGRTYVAQPCSVELSFQDDGRTLKAFVRKSS